MTGRTLRSVSLAAVLVIVGLSLSVAVPAAVAQEGPGDGEVNVFLETETTEEGQQAYEYEVVVEDADDGIGAYELNVSLGDTSVAEIVDYDLTAAETGNGPYDGSRITDNETLTLEVALGEAAHEANETDGSEFVVATVDVEMQEVDPEEPATLEATAVTEGEVVASPEVGQGGMDEAGFYSVLNLPATATVPPTQTEIELGLEPASLSSPPGDQTVFQVVANGTTDGVGAYNLSVELEDGSVAQFVEFTETGVDESDSEIRDGNGTPADAGPVVALDASPPRGAFEGEPDPVLAELVVEATGDIGAETSANITAAREGAVLEPDGNEYLTRGISGADYLVTAEMSLTFRDQRFGDAPGGARVTVRDVDTDGQQGTVILTYEDGNDTVVAGVVSGVFDGEDVSVTVEDLGGFTETGGLLVGEHTAHITLTEQLSQAYAPGDVVSAETLSAIIDRETGTVEEPAIPELAGLGIEITDGFSIADSYPLNQRSLFEQAESLYGLSGLDLPAGTTAEDERYAPIADGQHVGLGGLPVQDEVYDWAGPLLDFQTLAPTQTVAVSFDGAESSPVRLNVSEAQAHGLQVAELLTVAGENIAPDEYDVTLDNTTGDIVVSFDESAVGPDSPTLLFELAWEASDPVEGLDVPGTIDYETDHRVEQPVETTGGETAVDSERDNFVTFEAGATGIHAADVGAGEFLGEPVSETSLLSNVDAESAVDGEANPGSFLVWQDQVVTLETDTPGDTINIFEVATTTDQSGETVYTLGETVVGFDDTAPGRVANLDTSRLDADTRYFVTFGDDEERAAVLDVRELSLDAAPETETIPFDSQDRSFEVAISSADSTDNAFVETWFHFEGTDVRDVVHVERETLTGTGDRAVEINPALDLAGPGNYTVTVLHSESGVTEQFEFEIADRPTTTLVEAEDVTILSPDLFDPDSPSLFDRGDIVPIELELVGGNVATVTFGDQTDQNIEVHATVFDPTYDTQDAANNADTTVTVYLNTYQIGHGYIENRTTGDLEQNRPNWIAPGEWTNRSHGFFTDPADEGSALVNASELDREHNVYATDGMDIYGGSQGGAVISPGDIDEGPAGEFPGLRYDLHATGNVSPYTVLGDSREDERDDVNALDIEQRSTSGFTVYTAPGVGPNALDARDPTTIDDIESLKSEGILTPLDVEEVETGDGTQLVYNGTIAANDYLVVEADSSGLEGVIHEAVVRNSTLGVAAFLDRSDDHLLTSAFAAALDTELPRFGDSLLDYELSIFENTETFADRIGEPVENVEQFQPEQVILDMAGEFDRVVTGLDADGNREQYVLPYQLEPGDDLLDETLVDTDVATLEGGLTLDTGIELEPNGGKQEAVAESFDDRNVPTAVNPALDNGSRGVADIDRFDYVTPGIGIDPVHLGPAGLELPGEENYTLTGTSTMAPGTELNAQMLSRTGEGTPFARAFTGLDTVARPGDQPATWALTVDLSETRDDVAIQPGTTFETAVERAGPGTPSASFDGVVLDDPAVEQFVLDDQQRSDGAVVTVEAFDANRVAQITLTDEDGTELGTSPVLDRGLQEQFNIALDEPLDANTEVTATATIVKPEAGESFPDDERTANILVEDQQEAFFDVSGLSPTNGQVEQGATVTAEATVENLGDLEGTGSVTFSVVGTDISVSETVTLAGGDSTTVSFDLDTTDVPANDYTHQIASEDDTVSGALTVQAPPTPASFEIVSLSPADGSVTQGDELVVDVSVQNTGEQEATQEVVLSVSVLGEVGSRSLTLAGGAADSVSFTVDTTDVEAGDYTHSVSTDNVSAEGSLTVTEPAPADDSADDSTDDSADDNETDDNASSDDGSGPGFGIVVAALALLGAALLAMRRRTE